MGRWYALKRFDRFAVVLAATMAVVGCAAINPQEFKGPNGNTAYSMRCSGFGRTMDACYQTAGEVCPGGYQIIDRNSGTVAMPAYGGGVMAAPRETLVIECK